MKMTKWIKTIFTAASGSVIAGLFSATIYVSLILIFEDGIGLGDPVWKGFFLQVLFLSAVSIIFLLSVTIPAALIAEKFLAGIKLKLLVYCLVSFPVLYYCFVAVFDNSVLDTVIVPLAGTGLYCIYQYRQMRSM